MPDPALPSQDLNLAQLFLQSDVEDWCTEDRISRFKDSIRPLLPLFIWGCNKKDIAISWIRREMSFDIIENQNVFSQGDCSELLLSRRNAWDKKLNKNNSSFKSMPKDLDIFLLSDFALKAWAEKEWGHRIEALYLNRKSSLDVVTCSLLRVKDQYLAAELYYRLNNDGQDFDELSWKFAVGPEKKFGGKFLSQRVKDLPAGLSEFLRRLKPGEVSKPHKINKYFCIIYLESLVPAQFNEDTKQELFASELHAWLSQVEACLTSKL